MENKPDEIVTEEAGNIGVKSPNIPIYYKIQAMGFWFVVVGAIFYGIGLWHASYKQKKTTFEITQTGCFYYEGETYDLTKRINTSPIKVSESPSPETKVKN